MKPLVHGDDMGCERAAAIVGACASTDGLARLYSTLPEADALQSRQRTPERVREVIRFARPPQRLLARLSSQPLILSRSVASPNFEFLRFIQMATEANRPPLIFQMPHDRFTPSVNESKRALGRLRIVLGLDRHGRARTQNVTVVKFVEGAHLVFGEMRCLDGTSFLSFHDTLCSCVVGPNIAAALHDVTDHYAGEHPRQHYERTFALLTCFGVLAESYLLTGTEAAFTEEVVLPAFDAVVRRFGARPAIIRLLPKSEENDPHWESYPAAVLPFALQAAGR